MANQVTFIFKAIDKYTAVGRKISAVNQRMKMGFANLRRSIRKGSESLKAASKHIKKFGKDAVAVGKNLTMKLTAPILALGAVALKQSANLEALNISFEVLIGNAGKAKKVMDDLVQFTATTPFQLGEVANAGKQLLSFGVASEQLVPTLRRLGELAAGTGKPIQEFSLIYGKVLAKGKVQGEEVLQLAEKGISLQKIFIEQYKDQGLTADMFNKKLSQGKITFELFDKAIRKITDDGGKFHGLTDKLSTSLGGLTSTLKDSTLLAFKELGDVLVKELNLKELMSDLIVWINKLTKAIGSFAKKHPVLTKLILIFIGILAVIGPVLVVVGQLIVGFAALTFITGVLGTTTWALLAPILAIIAAIALFIVAIVMLIANWDDVVAGFKLAVADLPAFFDWIMDSVLQVFGTSLKAVRLKITDFIEAVVDGFKGIIESVVGFVTGVSDGIVSSVTGFIDKIMDRIMAFKDAISNFVTGIGEQLSSFFDFSGDLSTSASSTTDINIKLSAPQGSIQSMKSKTSGNAPGLNVGYNMMEGA